ncbi:MAG: FtsK/SpoIIIE domain-containing protein [Nanoarchaeota archaeon]
MDLKKNFKKIGLNVSKSILNDFLKSVGIEKDSNEKGYSYINNPKNAKETLHNVFITNNIYIKKENDIILPTIIKNKNKEWGKQLIILIPQGLSHKKITDNVDLFETALDKEVEIEHKGKRIYMKIFNNRLKKYYPYKKEIHHNLEKYKLGFPIGYTKTGFRYLELTKTFHHLLVGGIMGSGKSVFIRQGLYAMCQVYPKSYLNIYPIDLKGGLEAKPFSNIPQVIDIAKNKNEAIEMIYYLNNEILNERITKLENEGVTNINNSNLDLPYILIVFDEFAEVSSIGKAMEGIERLLRICRFAGMHLIIATQRPDRKIVQGQQKANIPATVAFKTRNGVNSRILLDDESSAELPNISGRGILQTNKNEIIQVPYLKTNKIYEKYGFPKKEETENNNEEIDDFGEVIGE